MSSSPPAEHRAHKQGQDPGPNRTEEYRLPEPRQASRANRLANQHLSGKGKAVEHISRKLGHVPQHAVGRKRDIAESGALRCEKGESEQKADGADHDIAIDGDETLER